MKLNILAHHWLGLVGTYWLGRQLGLSQYAGLLAAGAFMLSTWYSLHLYVGHTQFLSMAFVPWVLAFVHRARKAARPSVNISAAAALVALAVFEGGIYTVIFTIFLSGMLAVCWSVQEKSWVPLAVLVLTMSLAGGLCAVKVLPVVELLRENPRTTPVGGPSWSMALSGSDTTSVSRAEAGERETAAESRWPLIHELIKVFLGRNQRGNEIYFTHQEYGWHEYGAYLGPIIMGLIVLSPLVFRQQWPWLVSALGCFLIALGNFAPFAPWTLLHYFPVMNNARVPTRFLMPCVLALSILAGLVLDFLRARVKESRSALVRLCFKDTRREWATAFVVALCLADLALVGGRSLEETFDRLPQTANEKNTNIITIRGRAANMLGPMLQNYSTKNGYEEAHLPVRVSARGEESYRGEVYFVPVQSEPRGAVTETSSPAPIITNWSPNSVTVSVNTGVEGWLVVNRNWDDGWVSTPPYQAQSRNGLLSAALGSGEHLVRFSYEPRSVMVGAAITFVSLIAAVLWCWLDRRCLRSSQAP